MTESATRPFSRRLLEAGQPIYEAILDHPFVQGIAHGSLPDEALTFYVGQDFNYLNAFIAVYASAIGKCEHRGQMEFFSRQIDFILDSETHPHHVFCDVAGVPYESLQHEPMAPSTYLYTEHMHHAARTGDLIDVVASLTPCAWTYIAMAKTMVAEGRNHPGNVFAPWIDFYAGLSTTGESVLPSMLALLDEQAGRYGEEHLRRTEEIFLISCELEWEFWDQAWRRRGWRFVTPRTLTR